MDVGVPRELAGVGGELRSRQELEDGIRIAELEKQKADLEDQIKAWKDAASIEMVESSTEPRTVYEKPEALRVRLKQLYRWAKTETERSDESQIEMQSWRNAALDFVATLPPKAPPKRKAPR